MKDEKNDKSVYLDFASTTPIDKRVFRAMKKYASDVFGNPSSIHQYGQDALNAIDKSRMVIADEFGANFDDVLFAGSATEVNNLVLRGITRGALSERKKVKIIISSIEHDSIFETAKDLEEQGVCVTRIPVDDEGCIDLDVLKKELDENTVLVSIIFGNNEIGTVQNMREIGKIVADFKGNGNYPLLHTDAVQSFQFEKMNIKEFLIDFVTISAHKIYGPKGIGVLVGKLNYIKPIITGGGQEFGLRSGTQNTSAIVGCAEAVSLVSRARSKEKKKTQELKDYFWKNLHEQIKYVEINGCKNFNQALPHILNVHFTDNRFMDIVFKLNLAGIAVSSGSACSARAIKPSRVLLSLGRKENESKMSVRFSFGRKTTYKELDFVISEIKKFL